MTARIDCQCGGLTSLYFDTITVERSSEGQHLTEIHVPADQPPRRCLYFVAGLATRDEELLRTFLWNSAPSTVKEYADRLDRACNDLEGFLRRDLDNAVGCDVSPEGDQRPESADVP